MTDDLATERTTIEHAAQSLLGVGGPFTDGPMVRAFEGALASHCGTRHGVGVGSGTAALRLALIATGTGPGTEVITASHAPVWTATAVALTGAAVRFVDVDPRRGTIDPAAVAAAINERTAAIIALHLDGMPADMDPIMEAAGEPGIPVIEVASDAIGAFYRGEPVGSIGDLACFDFAPGQRLGAAGNAGAVTTSSGHLAEAMRRLLAEETGWHSPLDEIQAAVLSLRLAGLQAVDDAAMAAADAYDALLQGAMGVELPMRSPEVGTSRVFHRYVVRCENALALADVLAAGGVRPQVDRFSPVHRHAAFADRHAGHPLPVTERWADTAVALPLPLS